MGNTKKSGEANERKCGVYRRFTFILLAIQPDSVVLILAGGLLITGHHTHLKGRYHEIFPKFFLHIFVDIGPQKNNPERLLSKTFFSQEIWAVQKAYFKMLPVWAWLYE